MLIIQRKENNVHPHFGINACIRHNNREVMDVYFRRYGNGKAGSTVYP